MPTSETKLESSNACTTYLGAAAKTCAYRKNVGPNVDPINEEHSFCDVAFFSFSLFVEKTTKTPKLQRSSSSDEKYEQKGYYVW